MWSLLDMCSGISLVCVLIFIVIYASPKLIGIHPSGCERHCIQNFFQFIDQNSRPLHCLDAADIGGAVMDPAISKGINSTVDALIGVLSNNLTEVIESRLGSFAQHSSKENGATIDQALKKAHCENYTCKRKRNQQQLDHELEVLDNFDATTSALKNMSYDKVKSTLEEGTSIISKHIKAIQLADKSKFGWQPMNKYLSDVLATDSDHKKRMYHKVRRAERKIKGTGKCCRQPRPFTHGSSQPTSSNVSSNLQKPFAGDHEGFTPSPTFGSLFQDKYFHLFLFASVHLRVLLLCFILWIDVVACSPQSNVLYDFLCLVTWFHSFR